MAKYSHDHKQVTEYALQHLQAGESPQLVRQRVKAHQPFNGITDDEINAACAAAGIQFANSRAKTGSKSGDA